MVLVALKNFLTGRSDNDRKALLPTNRSYSSLDNADTLSRSSSSTSTLKDTFESPRFLSDMIIGLSDGLTVPFALTAGLSSLGDSKLVITGGLAELVSGAISMGLGGYLAARSEIEHFNFTLDHERKRVDECPSEAFGAIQNVLAEFSTITPDTMKSFITELEKSPEDTAKFIVRYSRGLEEPASDREFTSALTIGLAYFFGGFVPLVPYFFTEHVITGLYISVLVMGITLFIFGCGKTYGSMGSDCDKKLIILNGIKMMLTGGVAAAAAWGLVRAIDN